MNAFAKVTRLLMLVTMLAVPIYSVAAPPPHVGVWTARDYFDGSRAYIGVDADWRIVFYDTEATFGCRSGGGGPFIGFDNNYGDSVTLIQDPGGDVLLGHIEGICENGGDDNPSFDIGMRYFADSDTIRSGQATWDRTYIDEQDFVANAFAIKLLSSPFATRGSIWDFMGSYGGDDPQIIPGLECDWVVYRPLYSGIDLHACDLQGQRIDGGGRYSPTTQAQYVNLRGASLMGGSLTLHSIFDSDLSGMNLISARFYWVNLTNVNLRWSDLRFAEILPPVTANGPGWYSMQNVDLTGADMRGALIEQGHENTIWQDINFTRANLEGARFDGVNVVNAVFRHTICPDGSNSNDNGGTCDLTWSPP